MAHLDARFIQPLDTHDAMAWSEYAAADLASLPTGDVPVVVFFGDGVWQHPAPSEQGEQPHVREDGTVGYTHRYKNETMSAVAAVQTSGRKALAYVNPLRWRRLFDDGEAQGDPEVSLFQFCIELKEAGWSGVYFDGFPPAGKIETDEEDMATADWLITLRQEWPGVFVYQHGSGRQSPGLAEAQADVVLFGEWGDGWVDPGPWKPKRYARQLLKMGVEPVYKPASNNPDDVDPSRTQWFDEFSIIGAVVSRPADALQFDRAMQKRSNAQ